MGNDTWGGIPTLHEETYGRHRIVYLRALKNNPVESLKQIMVVNSVEGRIVRTKSLVACEGLYYFVE